MTIDEPVFVPEYHYRDVHGAETGPAKALYGRASYGLPSEVAFGFVVAAPLVGAAQAMLDDFGDDMSTRQDSLTQAAEAGQTSIQMRMGESAAEVASALHLGRSSFRGRLSLGAMGVTLSAEQRTAWRMAAVYDVELARRAATRLFAISGTAGMFSDSPLLRRFNDIYAGAKHFAFRWDEHIESYGRVRLGLDPSTVIR